jgi:hypothetical protein
MDSISHTSVADQIAPISCDIWNDKYRLKQFDGTPVDATIEDTWRRVARAPALRAILRAGNIDSTKR